MHTHAHTDTHRESDFMKLDYSRTRGPPPIGTPLITELLTRCFTAKCWKPLQNHTLLVPYVSCTSLEFILSFARSFKSSSLLFERQSSSVNKKIKKNFASITHYYRRVGWEQLKYALLLCVCARVYVCLFFQHRDFYMSNTIFLLEIYWVMFKITYHFE